MPTNKNNFWLIQPKIKKQIKRLINNIGSETYGTSPSTLKIAETAADFNNIGTGKYPNNLSAPRNTPNLEIKTKPIKSTTAILEGSNTKSTNHSRISHYQPTNTDTDMCPINPNKKAWSIAHLPIKTMGMTSFMLYMSGNNAGIFNIVIIGYALANATGVLLQINSNFQQLERATSKNFILQKSLYFLYSISGIFFILFKLCSMGLFPLNRGDYFIDAPPHTFNNCAIGLP